MGGQRLRTTRTGHGDPVRSDTNLRQHFVRHTDSADSVRGQPHLRRLHIRGDIRLGEEHPRAVGPQRHRLQTVPDPTAHLEEQPGPLHLVRRRIFHLFDARWRRVFLRCRHVRSAGPRQPLQRDSTPTSTRPSLI